MRSLVAMYVVVLLVASVRLVAQSPSATPRHDTTDRHHASVSFGLSAGTLSYGKGGSQQSVAAVLSAELLPGFSVSVNPSFASAQLAPTVDATTGALVPSHTVRGMSDLPIDVGYWHSFTGRWSPGIGLSLGGTLPTADTATGGAGSATVGTTVSFSVEPAEGWSMDASAGRSLSNGYATALGSVGSTSLSVGGSRSIGGGSVSANYYTEAGALPAGTTPSRSVGVGVTVPLWGDVVLNVDASSGRADGASHRAVAVGVGTTFADVGSTALGSAQRLSRAFGKGRKLGKTRSAAAKANRPKKTKP